MCIQSNQLSPNVMCRSEEITWKISGSRSKITSEYLEMSSTVSTVFHLFQTELDGRHDKYESLVKLSRDITVASKRVIFSVHRISRCVYNVLTNPCSFKAVVM